MQAAPGAPDPGHLAHGRCAFGDVSLVSAAAAMGNAGRDHAVLQRAARGHAQPAVVQERALAFFGRIQLVHDGIVDDAGHELPLALQRDRNRKQRDAVQEIGGAVERIDDPAVRLVGAGDLAALFHQEAVSVPRLGQLVEDDVFGAMIGGGDEVARVL